MELLSALRPPPHEPTSSVTVLEAGTPKASATAAFIPESAAEQSVIPSITVLDETVVVATPPELKN